MHELHTQVMGDELVEPVAANNPLCYGALDVETSQRLHPTKRVEPHHTPRPLRLADVRRVM